MPRVFAAPEVMASSAIKKDIGKIRDSLNAMFYPEVKPKGPISLPTQEEVNRINFQIVTVSKNSRSFENVASAERSEEVKTAREDLYKLVNKIQQEFYGGKVNKYDLGSLKNIESDSKEEIKNVMQENADKVAREMNLGVPERYTYSKRILGQAFSQLSQTEDAPLLEASFKAAMRSGEVSSSHQESQAQNPANATQNAGTSEIVLNPERPQGEGSRIISAVSPTTPTTNDTEHVLLEMPPNYWKRVIGGVVLAAGAASALYDDKIGMYLRNALPKVPQGIIFKTAEELGVALAAAGMVLYMSANRKPILAEDTITDVSKNLPSAVAVNEIDASKAAFSGFPSRAERKRSQRKKTLHNWINAQRVAASRTLDRQKKLVNGGATNMHNWINAQRVAAGAFVAVLIAGDRNAVSIKLGQEGTVDVHGDAGDNAIILSGDTKA